MTFSLKRTNRHITPVSFMGANFPNGTFVTFYHKRCELDGKARIVRTYTDTDNTARIVLETFQPDDGDFYDIPVNDLIIVTEPAQIGH